MNDPRSVPPEPNLMKALDALLKDVPIERPTREEMNQAIFILDDFIKRIPTSNLSQGARQVSAWLAQQRGK